MFTWLLLPVLASAQVTGSLTIVGNSSAKTSDWLGMFKTNRAILTVTNSSFSDYTAVVDIEVYNGSGTLIARSNQERQIPQLISAGATMLDLADVVPNDPSLGAMELLDYSLFDPLGRGLIPEDNYQICVNLIDVDTRRPLFMNKVCRMLNVRAYQAPILMMPVNGHELTISSSRPILRWAGVTPMPLFPVRYRVQVYEVYDGQSIDIALLTNPPILDETVIATTMLVWPPEYELPRQSYTYVWSVQALDDDLNPLGEPNGRATPFSFRVTSVDGEEEEEISEEVQDLLDKGQAYRVSGKVVDDFNRKGVSNATVTVSGTVPAGPGGDAPIDLPESLDTDNAGNFSFIALRGATFTLSAESNGYLDGEGDEITVHGESENNDIFLEPKKGKVAGKITTNNGASPLSGVSVHLCTRDEFGLLQIFRTATTDEQGKYELSYYAGKSFILNVEESAFELYTSKALEIKAEKTKTKDIDLIRQTVDVKGIITDYYNQNPIRKAAVAIYRKDDLWNLPKHKQGELPNLPPPVVSATVTDATGLYQFKDVPLPDPGENYWIKTTAERHGATSGMIRLYPSDKAIERNLFLIPLPLSLKGRVTNAEGEGIADIKIDLFEENRLIKSLTTNGNGDYAYSDKDYQNVTKLVTYHIDYNAVEVLDPIKDFTQSNHTLDLQLEKAKFTVKGKVTDQYGYGLGNATITCEDKTVKTDRWGNFIIEGASSDPNKSLTVKYGEAEHTQSFRAQRALNWRLNIQMSTYRKKFWFLPYTYESGSYERLSGVTVVLKDPNDHVFFSGQHTREGWMVRVLDGSKNWIGKEITATWEHPEYQTEIYHYKIENADWFDTYIDLYASLRYKQNKHIKGIVKDVDGNPLPGVEVALNGSSEKTITKSDGTYLLENLDVLEKYTLIFNKEDYEEGHTVITGDVSLGGSEHTFQASEVTMKRMLIVPETLFGFACQVTEEEQAPGGLFSIKGTLTIPESSPLQVRGGEIPFDGITIDKEGKPVSGQMYFELGTELMEVTLYGIPLSAQNPKIGYLNNAGQRVSMDQESNTGVITADFTLSDMDARLAEGEPGAIKIPGGTISTDGGSPLGMYASGDPGVAIYQPSDPFFGMFKGLQVDGMQNAGLTEGAKLTFQTEVDLMRQPPQKIKLIFRYSAQDVGWVLEDVEGGLAINALKDKFALAGDLIFNGDINVWEIALKDMALNGEVVTLLGSNLLPIGSDGRLGDAVIDFEKMNFNVGNQPVSTSQASLSSLSSDNLQVNASTMADLSIFDEPVPYDLVLGQQGGQDVRQTDQVTRTLMNPSLDGIMEGVEVDLIESSILKEGDREYWRLAGNISLSMTDFSTYIEGAFKLYDDAHFDLDSAYFKHVVHDASFGQTFYEGKLKYSTEEAIDDVEAMDDADYETIMQNMSDDASEGLFAYVRVSLGNPGGPTGFGATLQYKNKHNWSVETDYAPKNAIEWKSVPIDQAVVRFNLKRAGRSWEIGLGGDFVPPGITIPPFIIRADGTLYISAQPEFRLDFLGSFYTTKITSATGTVDVDVELGTCYGNLDFVKREMNGTIETMELDYPAFSAKGSVNFFMRQGQHSPNIGRQVFVVEGNGYASVLGTRIKTKYVLGTGIRETEWYRDMVYWRDRYQQLKDGQLGIKDYISDLGDALLTIEKQAFSNNEEVLQRLKDVGIAKDYSSGFVGITWIGLFPLFTSYSNCMSDIANRVSPYSSVPLFVPKSIEDYFDDAESTLEYYMNSGTDKYTSGNVMPLLFISNDNPRYTWKLGEKMVDWGYFNRTVFDKNETVVTNEYWSSWLTVSWDIYNIFSGISSYDTRKTTSTSYHTIYLPYPMGSMEVSSTSTRYEVRVLNQETETREYNEYFYSPRSGAAFIHYGKVDTDEFGQSDNLALLKEMGEITSSAQSNYNSIANQAETTKDLVDKSWKVQEEIRRANYYVRQKRSNADISKAYEAKYNTLNRYMDQIPNQGLVCNMSYRKSDSKSVDFGLVEASGGYEIEMDGELMMDADYNADMDFDAYSKAWASFEIGDWDVAECSMSTSFSGTLEVRDGEVTNVSGRGRGELIGSVGDDCSCNSMCLFGASACIDVTVDLSASSSGSISASVSFDD